MRPPAEVHDALACLLTYPGWEGNGLRYPAAIEVVALACPETAEDLHAFAEGISGLDAGQLQELYTRTFDNVGDRSLEVGWQLFGENYARGALMVRFRGLMRDHGVREQTELPDHLTHVLATLARIPEDVAAALATNQVSQAVAKILDNLRSYESPWAGVLEATRKVLSMHQLETSVTSEATR